MTAAFIAVLISSACSSCRRPVPSAELTDSTYREAVTAFYTGLAAMQTTQEVLAREKFDRVVTLAPQEPAGWANVGLLLLRQQEIDAGREHSRQGAGRDRLDRDGRKDGPSLVQDTADLVKTPPGDGLKTPDRPAKLKDREHD